MITLEELRGPARQAAITKLARKIKVQIVGEKQSMHKLIRASIAVKAAPEVHAVIRDEFIRLGVGRGEYRHVVKSLFNRIRKAIGWVDWLG